MVQIVEKDIMIKSKVEIKGTLTQPDYLEGEKLPAVIIIAGSGPINRDGDILKNKIHLNLYKDLAHFIASLGFITIRYDKRGVGESGGDYLSTGMFDLVDDAEKIYEYLEQHPNVDPKKIILAGHSEGTIIATALSERKNIGGLMLLSGGVDNIEQALYHQRQLAYKELMNKPGFSGWLNRTLKVNEKNEKKVEKMNQQIINSDKDVMKVQLFFKQPAKWMREHFSYNTRDALKKVHCPVFAIHGDKDNLVKNDVLRELDELVQGPVEYHIIQDMEHGLKEQKEPKSILKAKKLLMSSIGKPIHPDAKEKISGWLDKYFK